MVEKWEKDPHPCDDCEDLYYDPSCHSAIRNAELKKKPRCFRKMTRKIIIRVDTNLDGHHMEELEDVIAKAVDKFGVDARVFDEFTGNEMVTHER